MSVAPLSVVRRALASSMSITVARSANEVVTTNVFVYFDVLPPHLVDKVRRDRPTD